ncbi:MAG TPA: hypothetical protein EYG57_12540 [Planctomycetes bacterium]|nr:hypothetical protein [Planctomycetota bacterium]
MTFPEIVSESFKFAEGMVKQVLTLATASIGGIILIFDEKASGIQLGAYSWWLFVALVLLSVSIVTGVLSLGSLASQLGNPPEEGPSIYDPTTRALSGTQLLTYAAGIICAVVEVL